MKLKIILSLLIMVMSVSASYASFPVTRTATTSTTATTAAEEEAIVLTTPAASSMAVKNQTTALLLWFFLGGFAAHRWYLGSPIGWNILFILTFGGVGVWWIIDGIDIITENYPGL